MYRDGYGYRKMYVRKSDVGAVSDSIQEAKKTLDREYRNTLKLINQFHNYEIIQERIWKELEMNPEKYTQRAVILRLNQFALKN